ncbi:MAG: IS66 family insertion sequence element accessory protein TnpB [Clostridiales bacterium]|nr:IS66 family insertion sequence element accessory protein TnpB [Clostridiales bacterium]
MKSTTSLVARQCLLQEWAGQIRECHQRLDGMSVNEWCRQHGITKTTYYYRLRQVRKACLDNIPADKLPLASGTNMPQAVVAVPAALLESPAGQNQKAPELTVSVGKISIMAREDTPSDLLTMVLGAAIHVE